MIRKPQAFLCKPAWRALYLGCRGSDKSRSRSVAKARNALLNSLELELSILSSVQSLNCPEL